MSMNERLFIPVFFLKDHANLHKTFYRKKRTAWAVRVWFCIVLNTRQRIHHTPEGACVLRYIVIFHGNVSVSVIDAYAVSDQDRHHLSLL